MNTGPRRSNRPPMPDAPSTWITAPGGTPALSVAWISHPRVGEIVSGDSVIVRSLGATTTMVAVVDALGHGPNAAAVAKAATDWLETTPAEGEAAADIMQALHKHLQGSRGAATLVFLSSAKGVEACSVGNVELRSTTGKLPFVLTPGVLGQRLRHPKTCFANAPVVERFVLFSDGISGRFDLKALRSHSPAELATHIFATHRHTHDDSSVVVVDLA